MANMLYKYDGIIVLLYMYIEKPIKVHYILWLLEPLPPQNFKKTSSSVLSIFLLQMHMF